MTATVPYEGAFFNRLRESCGEDWQAYVTHPFVRQLGAGNLAEASFRHYLAQDYLFLIHFARAYALAIYKSETLADMRAAADTVKALLDVEMSLHLDYCRGWGMSEDDIVTEPEAMATMAYTRFVLERGMAGDVLDLYVALAPCVVGYGEIALTLDRDPKTKRAGNPFLAWIEMYAGDEYQQVAQGAVAQLDSLASRRLTAARERELATTFAQATRLEAGFWEMGLTLSR